MFCRHRPGQFVTTARSSSRSPCPRLAPCRPSSPCPPASEWYLRWGKAQGAGIGIAQHERASRMAFSQPPSPACRMLPAWPRRCYPLPTAAVWRAERLVGRQHPPRHAPAHCAWPTLNFAGALRLLRDPFANARVFLSSYHDTLASSQKNWIFQSSSKSPRHVNCY